MNKVAIVGVGRVGSTIAYTLAVNGLATEIVMIDVDNGRAQGEAMDIYQGTPFCRPCAIYAGSYSDARNADVVVLAAGISRKPGQSRLDLTQTNVNILKGIIPELVKYAPSAYYIIVSNPVDILTYVFCKYTGLPESHIIGTGTILDTSRLCTKLSESYAISQHNVHAYVMGEHGDSSFIPWSLVDISSMPLDVCKKQLLDTRGLTEPTREEVEKYVQKSGANIIERKGATFYAVSLATNYIIRCLLNGIDTAVTVSTMMHGEYGVEDVCLSIVNMVGKKGAHSKLLLPMTDSEIAQLHHSADCLKEVIRSIDI